VLASPREPGHDGGVAMPEHAHRGGDRESFGQRRQHFANSLGRGFEAIQRGIAAGAEGGITGGAAQRLSALAPSVRTVTNERVDLRIGEKIVRTRAVGAREARGVDPPHRATATFHLPPGRHGGT
jgi:hypothetical protein